MSPRLLHRAEAVCDVALDLATLASSLLPASMTALDEVVIVLALDEATRQLGLAGDRIAAIGPPPMTGNKKSTNSR